MLKYFLILNLLFAGSLVHCMQPKTYGKKGSSIHSSTIVTVPTQYSLKRKQTFIEKTSAKKPKLIEQKIIDLTEEEAVQLSEKYSFADNEELPVETRTKAQIKAQNQTQLGLSESLRPEQQELILNERKEKYGNTVESYNDHAEANTVLANLKTPKRSKYLAAYLRPLYGNPAIYATIYGTPMPDKR